VGALALILVCLLPTAVLAADAATSAAATQTMPQLRNEASQQTPTLDPAEPLTVDMAVKILTAHNPQLTAARAKTHGTQAAANSLRGRLLPGIHLSDSQQWSQTEVGLTGQLAQRFNPTALKIFPSHVTANVFSVGARQPLLSLLPLSYQLSAMNLRAEASAKESEALQSILIAQVKVNFLRLFEAQSLAATAAASQHDLEAQVQTAQFRVDAGALTLADVLRLKVAAANAAQQVIEAQGQAATLRAMLLEMLGKGEDAGRTTFVEPEELKEVATPKPLAQARSAALKLRPEYHQVMLEAQAARNALRAKTFALLPDLQLEAAYLRVVAQPFDVPSRSTLTASSGSVGIKAEWAVWEWGTTYYEREQASAQSEMAAAQVLHAQQQIGIEVASRRAEATSAAASVQVAEVQVRSAEEAYRVMQALIGAGSATTTDLLDAEAALTQARLSQVRARYEMAVSTVLFKQAMGSP
jgi:outer membrane protein